MDEVELIKWGFLLVLGGFTFMLQRELKTKDESITQLKGELVEVRNEITNVKQNYLHRDDFKEFKGELRAMFDEIRKDLRALKVHEKD